eukprot:gene3263-3541_t
MLQQMQLDRLRMQWELYARGRLQQRRAALLAELTKSQAAAATATAETAGKIGASPTDSVIPIIRAKMPQQDQQGLHQQLVLQASAQKPSRGILIVAGTRHQLANALVTIMVLRQSLNCSLPVEIVYYGAAEYDDLMAQILHRYNETAIGSGSIFLVDGLDKTKGMDLGYHYKGWAGSAGSSNVTGFATKAHALAYVTRFQQVLLLDADSLPLIDPVELFSTEEFQSSGNLFWPDFWHRMWIHEAIYKKLGQSVPWHDEPKWKSAESGQVLFDRLRHVDVLEWLWWLNSHSNITYSLMHGDKDTFRLAFSLAGKVAEHRQVIMPARDALGYSLNATAGLGAMFQHQGMVQHTPGADQRPAFLHRTGSSTECPVFDCVVSNY